MIKYFSGFSKFLNLINVKIGDTVKAKIVSIGKKYVLVDSSLKSESYILLDEFRNFFNKIEIKVGDIVNVVIELMENECGETILSREKAKLNESWCYLQESYNKFRSVMGYIEKKVKGGYIVDLDRVKAFLPGSLTGLRPINKHLNLEGYYCNFKIIKIDRKRNNVILSRRLLIKNISNSKIKKMVNSLLVGSILKGIVKNITSYGAFINLDVMDGLLHITDISWRRVNHPGDFLKIGQEILVKVLRIDRKKKRVFLGLKQLSVDPWLSVADRHPKGSVFTGTITNITKYGFFVRIENNIEGLIHVSELKLVNKLNPFGSYKRYDKIKAVVLNVNKKLRRISLGLKKNTFESWDKFFLLYKKGSIVRGKIKSLTNFGIFVILKYNINGLVHLSNISWYLPGNVAIKNYKVNDVIDLKILHINSFLKRVSLGIKQVYKKISLKSKKKNKKGAIVIARIIHIHRKKLELRLSNNDKGVLFFNLNLNFNFILYDKITVRILGYCKIKKHFNVSLFSKHNFLV